MRERDNAADERIVHAQEEARKNDRKQEIEDIKSLMATPFGVRFVRRILAEGKVFSTTFTGNSQTFFLEGQRNLALKFFADIVEACPNRVSELITKGD